MKLVLAFLTIASVSALPQTPPAAAAPPATLAEDPTEFACQGGIWAPSPAIAQKMGKCVTDGPNPKCAFFCVGKIFDFLDDKGAPVLEKYVAFAKKNFPAQHHEFSEKHFQDCFGKFSDKIDKSDETCHQADMFHQCIWSLQPQLTC